MVVAGTQLTDADASKFFENGNQLLKEGASFSWVGDIPVITQQQVANYESVSGKIKVTYKDGNSHTYDVSWMDAGRIGLNLNKFYYVPEVGQKIDNSNINDNLDSLYKLYVPSENTETILRYLVLYSLAC